MKALTFATVCLLSTHVCAQDIAPAPFVHDPGPSAMFMQQQAMAAQQAAAAAQPAPQQNKAVAPAVFYAPVAGDRTVSPQAIEVEVPVYKSFEPRKQIQQIYSEIRDSQFYVEINPLRLSVYSDDFESNNITNDNPNLEYESNEFKLKLLPLDFKFGFENPNWGSFAEIVISDAEDKSQVVVYAKSGALKIGAGLTFSITDSDAKIKEFGVQTGKGESDSMQIGPYLYCAFQLSNDDSVSIEQWNKIGGLYEKEESNGSVIKGISFVFNPALDVMFKINPKLQIGTGVEFEYQRFSGDISVKNFPKYKGIGNSYDFELNLIKTKFLF